MKKKRIQYDDDSAESGDEDGAGAAFVLPADGCYYFLPGFIRMTTGNAGSGDEDGLSGPPPSWREPADEEEVKEFCSSLVLGLKNRFSGGGWDGMIRDLSACFDFTEYNLNSNGSIVDPNYGNAAMVRLVEFCGHTHQQPDGVTSEGLFDPDCAIIEWQTFKHRLAEFKTRQLSLDDAHKPILRMTVAPTRLCAFLLQFTCAFVCLRFAARGFFVDNR